MGKFPTSLLIIVLELYSVACLSADEQVRQVQVELRKRHLFYGNATGEFSPALTKAILRYQEKKGFARTGTIDSETRASLGLPEPSPDIATTPVVLGNNGQIRGPNGESLPDPSSVWAPDEYPVRSGLADIEREPITTALGVPNAHLNRPLEIKPKREPTRKSARPRVRKETNPVILAFQSIDHAVKSLLGDDRKKKRGTSKNL